MRLRSTVSLHLREGAGLLVEGSFTACHHWHILMRLPSTVSLHLRGGAGLLVEGSFPR